MKIKLNELNELIQKAIYNKLNESGLSIINDNETFNLTYDELYMICGAVDRALDFINKYKHEMSNKPEANDRINRLSKSSRLLNRKLRKM